MALKVIREIVGFGEGYAYAAKAAPSSRPYHPMNMLRHYRCTGAYGHQFGSEPVRNNGSVPAIHWNTRYAIRCAPTCKTRTVWPTNIAVALRKRVGKRLYRTDNAARLANEELATQYPSTR